MKYLLVLLLGIFPLLSDCSPPLKQKQTINQPKKIIPSLEEGGSPTGLEMSSDVHTAYSEKPGLAIALSPKDSPVQVLSKNLDVDSQDEQIIVVKLKDDADSPLRIILADFDGTRGHYVQAWEGKTGAVNINTFTVSFEDVIGDHQLQIICRGTDSRGDLTLDIFRHLSSSGLEISYYPVCNLVSDGTIDIIESERDASYTLGYSFGASFPIVVYRTDPTAANINQIIKETYSFYNSTGRYTLDMSLRLSSEKVEESQLNTIISSDKPDVFEQHLRGFWYRENNEPEEQTNYVVLFFDLEKREIVLYSKEVQEIYRWKGSKHFYKNLTIFAENELLQSVSPQFTVTLSMIDRITLTISEPSEHEQWGGNFIRVKKEMEASIFPQPKRITEPVDLKLAGRFESKDGLALVFQKPFFTWIEKDASIHEGGYAVFSFRQKDVPSNVLFLKFIIENGLYANDKVYIVSFKEQARNASVVRTLTLTPAKVSVYGINEKIEEPLVLTQEAPL